MNVKKRVKEVVTEGAAVLDAAESDPRALRPTANPSAPPPGRKAKTHTPVPESAEVRPSAKELGREHRGY